MFDYAFEKAAALDGRIRQFVQELSQEYDAVVFSNTFGALYSSYGLAQLDIEKYTEQLIDSGFVSIESDEPLIKQNKEEGELY